MDEQIEELNSKTKEPHIVIATPGRLFDLLKNKAIKPENVRFGRPSANTSSWTSATR